MARLRDRYRVVLVDEFQDTDPIQWEILQRAFSGGGVTLVLIGDPKQAIYAFRGADVYSYLEAKQASGETATLEVNRRSDQRLIDAYDAMFGGAKLGHPEIVYGRVRAGGEREPFAVPGRAAAGAGGRPRRPLDREDPPGLRGAELGADVHRARPRGGPGAGARVRRAVRPGRRRGAGPLQPPRGARCATRWTTSASRR